MRGKLVFGTILFLVAASVSAEQLLYEPFDYAPGTGLENQSPDGGVHTWAKCGAATNVDQPSAISGNLDVPPALGPSTGNSASYGGRGFTDRINLTTGPAFTTDSVFYSMAVKVAATSTSVGNTILCGLNNTTGPQATNPSVMGGVLWARPGTTTGTYNLGLSQTTATAGRTYGPEDYALGSTVYVVVAYDFAAGANNDQARVWLLPTTASLSPDTIPAPTATVAPGTVTDLNWAASFLLYQTGGTASLPEGAVTVDELRVGRAWADVVPEPMSAVFLGLGGMLLTLRRRR